MQQITDEIRAHFTTLRQSNDLKQIIHDLNRILTEATPSNALLGFCRWNLSDCYALLRMADEEYQNLQSFFEFVNNMPLQYRFWCVCDATQRLTLEVGGYGALWWDIYCDAVDNNPQYAERIAFEAHRAALYVNPVIQTQRSDAEFAAKCFKDFLRIAEHSDSIDFYTLAYSALCLENFGHSDLDFDGLCELMLPRLQENGIPRTFALGEWEDLNVYKGKRTEAEIGINMAINSLIRIGRTPAANDLYCEAKQHGMKPNTYLERKLAK